jgi:uncharacterized membrane protein YgdD (TMEM256/DUF423 family)
MVNKWVDTSMRWVSNFILFGVAFFIGSLLISWVQAVADGVLGWVRPAVRHFEVHHPIVQAARAVA